MSKKYFLPRTDNQKATWLTNFSNKLAGYATKYGITAPDVADMQACSTSFNYWLNYLNQYNEYLRKVIQYKNELRNGESDKISVVPAPPAVGVAPAAVNPGIFSRAGSLAQIIKSNHSYTLADGNDLGLEGDEIQDDDMNTVQPNIQVRLINGGQPEIVWKRKASDGIDIYVDRGTGSFQFLATDTVPNYIDTFPLATGAAVWKYRCIYRKDDAQVGQWSDTINVTVNSGI